MRLLRPCLALCLLPLISGCKTAGSDTPDAGQPAVCTFFLPSGNQQPPCAIDAGDMASSGNGHIRVTLQNQGSLSFARPMDFQVRGALQAGIYRFAQLLPESSGGVTVTGDQAYLVAPSFNMTRWGDAVLQLIFTERLFQLFPDYTEGQLTKLRSRLVSRVGLKVHAISLALGDYLMMGRGEENSGGRARASALADAYEALIGAMYLDSDFATVKKFVLEEAKLDLETLQFDTLDVNPKGKLQEILQAESPQSPQYNVVSETGPEHHKIFVSEVVWNGITLGQGSGNSKKEAEKVAAEHALHSKLWMTGSPTTPE